MMRFDRFTERAQDAAQRAAEIIQRYGHNQIDTEHLLLALLEQPDGVTPQILEKLNVNVDLLSQRLDAVLRSSPKASIYGQGTGQIFITPRVKRVIDLANEEANRLKDEYISTEHVFLAIITAEHNTNAGRILAESGITKERVMEVIREIRGGQRVTDPQAESRYRTLEKYSRDLTQMAKEGKLDPVIGRDDEILRVVQILSRRTKNNPVLIGEAGVGKTAIVEGLGPEDRHRRRAGDPDRQTRGGARSSGDDRRFAVPGRIRGTAEGGDRGNPARGRGSDPLHRRIAHGGRGGGGPGRDGRLQHAQAGPRARRAAMRGRDHPRRIPQTHRKGRRARTAVRPGLRRRTERGGNRRHAARPARPLRGAPQGAVLGCGAGRGGQTLAPLCGRPAPAGQSDRPDG